MLTRLKLGKILLLLLGRHLFYPFQFVHILISEEFYLYTENYVNIQSKKNKEKFFKSRDRRHYYVLK